MKKGDWVVYRSSFDRRIYVGRISGEYRFDPAISEQYPNIRAVAWQKTLPLTAVSQGALHELGSALTLFQLKNYGDEFIEATEGRASAFDEEDDESASEVTAEVTRPITHTIRTTTGRYSRTPITRPQSTAMTMPTDW
jgi:restriction system protein